MNNDRRPTWSSVPSAYHYLYTGRPLAALQGLDRGERVIYLGTFSKILFSALRLASLVVPADLVDAFAMTRSAVSRHPPLLEQDVLAAFIAEGHFAWHMRRKRVLYGNICRLAHALRS